MALTSAGDTFTFHVLFLDGTNMPIAPPDPNIEVFTFDTLGNKVTIVPAGTVLLYAGAPGEYKYTYAVPTSWPYQVTLYGIMRCTDPTSLLTIIVEEEVSIVSGGGGVGPACRGLTAQFVRGG